MASDSERPIDRLSSLIRDREKLSAELRAVQARIGVFGSPQLDEWAEASVRLINVNAGPGLLLAYWQASVRLSENAGLPPLAALGRDMADICREASTQAANDALLALAQIAPRLSQPATVTAWSRMMVLVAREAPESVTALARQLVSVATRTDRDSAGFERWVRTGLRACGSDPRRRNAFFSLSDPLAWRTLQQGGDDDRFSLVKKRLEAYVTALWAFAPRVQIVDAEGPALRPRRVSLVDGIIRMPDRFDGTAAEAAGPLFQAAMAHAGAHIAYGSERFAIGKLKPTQIILISLIEDARVEHLAMRRFPGLQHVWAPFHVARSDGPPLAPLLLARLARALLDPAYADSDGWVGKGRRLFEDAKARLEDPGVAREIGGLLGNDLGQMRLRLDTDAYVVEPAYRDDNMGLWAWPDDPDRPPTTIEADVDVARLEPSKDKPDDRTRQNPETEPDESGVRGARPVQAEAGLRKIATYPEWDYAVAVERPDWATVYEFEPPAYAGRADPADALLTHRLTALLRKVRIGQPVRKRRLRDGEQLDLDPCIEATIAWRGGLTPETHIYQARQRARRDMSVLVMLDASASTADRVPGAGKAVIQLEADAAALLAEAMQAVGDRFALRAFASDGRDHVHIARIKDFDAAYDSTAQARLASLRPQLSTRIGTAIRHAGVELSGCRSHRRVLLLVSDGEPFDIDVDDADYLVEDARRAVLGLRTSGIDTFCLGLSANGDEAGVRIFGRANYIPARRLEELPEQLSTFYFRLSVR